MTAKQTAPGKLLYDHDDAAELLAMTPRRVHELRRAGQLAAVQDGRKFKFTRDELERYVAALPSYEPAS
jgi:excisionase family DNA binding protein